MVDKNIKFISLTKLCNKNQAVGNLVGSWNDRLSAMLCSVAAIIKLSQLSKTSNSKKGQQLLLI